MAKIFADQAHGYANRVIFNVGSDYSMGVAAQILSWLETHKGCVIQDDTWRLPDYGNLIEVGIPIWLGTIQFSIMCSYSDILIERLSGSKSQFYELCDEIRELDLDVIE